MKLGLIYALPAEIENLLHITGGEEIETVCGVPFYRLNENIVAAAGGMGKVNAAMATQLMIDRYAPDLLFNAGIAGAMADLEPYTVALATSFMQHDVDTSGIGDPVGMISTVYRTEFPAAFTEESRAILRAQGVAFAEGLVASADWFTVDCPRAREVERLFHPALVDMESGAVAQVAFRAGIPCMALKCVSDCIFRGEHNGDQYHFNFDDACRRIAEVTAPFILAWAER